MKLKHFMELFSVRTNKEKRKKKNKTLIMSN